MDFLKDNAIKHPWAILKKLSEKVSPAIDIRLIQLVQIEPHFELIKWIAFGIARAIGLPPVKEYSQFNSQKDFSSFFDFAIEHFLTLIKESTPSKLDPATQEYFKLILNHLANELSSLDSYDDQDYWDQEGITPEEYDKDIEQKCDTIRSWLNL